MSKGKGAVKTRFSIQPDRKDAAEPPKAQAYLLPFKHAIKALGLDGDVPKRFEVTREQLDAFLAVLLKGAEFDEDWYLSSYADIQEAVANGDIASARTHFVEYGYREGRYPGPVEVDEAWYLAEYPDIAEGIELEEIGSAREHFESHGRGEGRMPHAV